MVSAMCGRTMNVSQRPKASSGRPVELVAEDLCRTERSQADAEQQDGFLADARRPIDQRGPEEDQATRTGDDRRWAARDERLVEEHHADERERGEHEELSEDAVAGEHA